MRRLKKNWVMIFVLLAAFFLFPSVVRASGLSKSALKPVTVKASGLTQRKDATKITLAKSSKVIAGFKKKLTPKIVVKGEKLTGLRWTSSNTGIASVSGSGIVTGKKKGTAVITCRLSNGKKYTCKMTVRENRYHTGKTISNCIVDNYPYGYVSLELSSIWYSGGKLYTKWVALNNNIYKAVKMQYADIELKDKSGKSFAKKRFTNVALNLGNKQKKYITLVFPAGIIRTINLTAHDFTWRYYTYNVY